MTDWCKKLVDSGLLTLSRFRIVKKEFYEYKNYSGFDCVLKRGVLYTKQKVKDCYIHHFNTHA